jgi:hypothetical protein
VAFCQRLDFWMRPQLNSGTLGGRSYLSLAMRARNLLIAELVLVAAVLPLRPFKRVTLANESTVLLSGVSIAGRGFSRTLANLSPGDRHTFWFIPSGDTGLQVRFSADGHPVESGSLGYWSITPFPQKRSVIRVTPRLAVLEPASISYF